ncbi:MAG: hypothetical protein HGA44_23505 [Cellulomonadaceae bacterium]|nr:hypothetical protein [Cellulomonadaceae bacterium]
MDAFWPALLGGIVLMAFGVLAWGHRASLAELNRQMLGIVPGSAGRVRRSSTSCTVGFIAIADVVLGASIFALAFFPSQWG